MNFEKSGCLIGEIRFKGNTKRNRKLYLDSNDDDIEDAFTEIKLKNRKEFIQPLPNKNKEREILYISGQSGSGKSYYSMLWANEYKKMYPKNKIYLISSLAEDAGSIDKIKDLKKIKLSEEFLSADLTTRDFKNSLVIFDDTDVIRNKKIREKVITILNMLLETGRHSKTSVILTYHLPTNGNETRRILNEAHALTIFPANMGGRATKYLLENYFGMDKETIKKIKKLPSRWVSIVKSYPNVILYEKGAFLVNHEDDD